MRRSSGKDPLLVVASLADASTDGVDAATLSFLTASALEARRKEEEEEERQAVETARSEARYAWQVRYTRTRVELNGLVNLGVHRTPAQLRRMVELAEELDVINAIQARAFLNFFVPEEEEKEEEEEASEGFFAAPPVAALVVDNDSGSLAVLVFLVSMYLALCFLLASSGPRCSAFWPVWSRRTAAVVWQGWYCC